MKLFELFLLEYKGDKIAQAPRGYINSRTGEVLSTEGNLPHSSIIATHPEKFNLTRGMQEELPREHEIVNWSFRNDTFAGPWQHAAYETGWVRYSSQGRFFNLSGYPEDLKAILSMPGVIITIVNTSREYGVADVSVDIIVPNYHSVFDSYKQPVKSAGDVVKLKDRIK